MRTLRVYTYDELDEAAKKRAVDSVRYKVGGIIADFDGEDYKKSLNTIENAFSIDVFNWEVGYRGHHSWRTDGIDLDIDEPRMLCRYLETVYYNVHQGKYIGWHKGKGKAYYSRVLSGEDSFSPNGEWTDDAIVCLMLKRYEYVRMGWTIREFIDHLLDTFFSQWEKDYEDAFSDEGVRDQLEYNDRYEFYEDGTLYN